MGAATRSGQGGRTVSIVIPVFNRAELTEQCITSLAAATTGENTGPYDTQDVAGQANPTLLVKDHSESDLRADPKNPEHLIGQSKWFVNAEGYNHLLGFYESWDGGATWPAQGHVPGYEGWVDNTDPVGAFDPWSNFYSLVLAYNFSYDKNGGHVYNNGSNQTNPTVPPEAVAVSVRPHGATDPKTWITKPHVIARSAGISIRSRNVG